MGSCAPQSLLPLPRSQSDHEANDALLTEWRAHRFLKTIGMHRLLLKQPYWYRLVGTDRRNEDDRANAEMSVAAKRAQRRNERKFAKQRQYAPHGPAEFLSLAKAA